MSVKENPDRKEKKSAAETLVNNKAKLGHHSFPFQTHQNQVLSADKERKSIDELFFLYKHEMLHMLRTNIIKIKTF